MNDSPHIIVVEDDREIGRLISRYLGANACRVSLAGDGREMDRIMAVSRINLVVLDLMLPGEDGLKICRRLRSASDLPIIMLTARGEDVDRILGLELGADDYLTKPFNPRELLARIRAVLRRTQAAGIVPSGREARVLSFLGWRLDRLLRELTAPDGTTVVLTGAEFDLLSVLCERSGRVLSRDQLLDLTQGRQAGSFERSIDVLISRLRRKIEADPHHPVAIKTVRSGGYLFTPVVETS
jgi:two-component system, OmpR family, response regulator